MIDDVAEDSPRTVVAACTILDWVLVFFASIVTAVIGSAIGRALGGAGSLTETSGGLIGLWVAIVPSAVLLSRKRGTGSLAVDFALRFDRRDWVGVPIGFASQLMLLPVVYVVVERIMGRSLDEELRAPAEELTNQADPGAAFALLAALLIVGAPVVEEIFYRGMLFVALRRRLAVLLSVLLCGAIFGAAHLQPLLFPGLAAFGIVLAWVRARSGRLGTVIVAHATFNAITVAALAVG